jgi:hypothetical protein
VAVLVTFLSTEQGYNNLKKSGRFDSKRDDWCRLENFEDMYNIMYEKLLDAGIADVLHDEVWLDRYGDIVQTEEETYGQKTKYLYTQASREIDLRG